jgi:hypothetical protein
MINYNLASSTPTFWNAIQPYLGGGADPSGSPRNALAAYMAQLNGAGSNATAAPSGLPSDLSTLFGQHPTSFNAWRDQFTALIQQLAQQGSNATAASPQGNPQNYLMSVINQWPQMPQLFRNALLGLGNQFGSSPNFFGMGAPINSPFWQGQTNPTPSSYGGFGG